MVDIVDILENPDNHSKEEILAKLRELLVVNENENENKTVKGPRKRGKMEGLMTGKLNDTEYIFHPKVEEKLTEIADLPIVMLDNILQGIFGLFDKE